MTNHPILKFKNSYKINGRLRFQTINIFSNIKVLFIIYKMGMLYEMIRGKFRDSKI